MIFSSDWLFRIGERTHGLIRKKWFSALQFESLKIQTKLFEDYYRDACKIKKQDMIRFLQANSSYRAKPSLANTTARVVVLVGGKEQRIMRRSAEVLHDTIPDSSLKNFDRYYHGECSLNHPDDYVDLLTCLVSGM
jgi:hypothetical protein